MRVHSAPGEEMQVDFGTVGQLYDPETGRIRTAYVFVATLSYSRHQYAELVFDQKVVTWIALHRQAFDWFVGVVKGHVVNAIAIEALKRDFRVLARPAHRLLADLHAARANGTQPLICPPAQL
jgi:transposase